MSKVGVLEDRLDFQLGLIKAQLEELSILIDDLSRRLQELEGSAYAFEATLDGQTPVLGEDPPARWNYFGAVSPGDEEEDEDLPF